MICRLCIKSGFAYMQVGNMLVLRFKLNVYFVTEEVLAVQSKRYVAFHMKVTRADVNTS